MLQRGLLRLIEKCGLHIYNYFFLFKFQWVRLPFRCAQHSGNYGTFTIASHFWSTFLLQGFKRMYTFQTETMSPWNLQLSVWAVFVCALSPPLMQQQLLF